MTLEDISCGVAPGVRKLTYEDYFLLTTQLCQTLKKAIGNEQKCSFEVAAGITPSKTWDGSVEFRIFIFPPEVATQQ